LTWGWSFNFFFLWMRDLFIHALTIQLYSICLSENFLLEVYYYNNNLLLVFVNYTII
jgi:hypothetical protein